MKITVREGRPLLQVRDMEGVSRAIADAASEAQASEKLSVVFLEADSGNEISIAVGGDYLSRRGLKPDEIEAVLGGNFLRVLREAFTT